MDSVSEVSSTDLERFQPEPLSDSSINFQDVLSTVGNVAGSVLRSATGVSFSTSVAGVDSDYAAILNKQIALQEQMMMVSMQSNLIKTEHETKMAPVRNLRAG